MLAYLLKEKNMSLYRLEKITNIPHSTLSDIYNERCDMEKVSISIYKKIADALKMDIDSLYETLTYRNVENYFAYDKKFDLFKSNLCQELKYKDDKVFVDKYVSNNEIRELIKNKCTFEAIYLLAMIDYVCHRNNWPVINDYDDLRHKSFKKLIVPESLIILMNYHMKNYTSIRKEVIPEFLSHNIAEAYIDDVA